MKKRRGASREAPLRLNLELSLVIQLQSELDLSRIVWSITRRADLAEVLRVGEIRGAGDGNDAVAAESRSVEVWMIEDVEDLRSELQAEAFREFEILEDRKVEPVEAGSDYLGHAAQGGGTCQSNASGRPAGSQHARLSKRGRIAEPTQLPVRVGVKPQLRALAGNEEIAAAQALCRPRWARKLDGLPSLECGAPNDAPTSDRPVRKAR